MFWPYKMFLGAWIFPWNVLLSLSVCMCLYVVVSGCVCVCDNFKIHHLPKSRIFLSRFCCTSMFVMCADAFQMKIGVRLRVSNFVLKRIQCVSGTFYHLNSCKKPNQTKQKNKTIAITSPRSIVFILLHVSGAVIIARMQTNEIIVRKFIAKAFYFCQKR